MIFICVGYIITLDILLSGYAQQLYIKTQNTISLYQLHLFEELSN